MFTLLTSLVTAINNLATTWVDEIWPTLWHDVSKVRSRRFRFKRWRVETGFWIKEWGLGFSINFGEFFGFDIGIGPFFFCVDKPRFYREDPEEHEPIDAGHADTPQEDFYEIEEDVERVEED